VIRCCGNRNIIGTLKQKLAEADGKRERVLGLYRDNVISETEVKKQLAHVEDDVAILTEELSRLTDAAHQRDRAKETVQTVRMLAGRVTRELIDGMPVPERKALIRLLVERVVIGPDNSIAIDCVIPDVTEKAVGNVPVAALS